MAIALKGLFLIIHSWSEEQTSVQWVVWQILDLVYSRGGWNLWQANLCSAPMAVREDDADPDRRRPGWTDHEVLAPSHSVAKDYCTVVAVLEAPPRIGRNRLIERRASSQVPPRSLKSCYSGSYVCSCAAVLASRFLLTVGHSHVLTHTPMIRFFSIQLLGSINKSTILPFCHTDCHAHSKPTKQVGHTQFLSPDFSFYFYTKGYIF